MLLTIREQEYATNNEPMMTQQIVYTRGKFVIHLNNTLITIDSNIEMSVYLKKTSNYRRHN